MRKRNLKRTYFFYAPLIISAGKGNIMDLWQLRYFVKAAETLNFTKAAESLFITQSALSKKIADMEMHFGVQLFLRGKKNLAAYCCRTTVS